MKTATIKFRSTPEWKEALRAKAEAKGQSLSTYIMRACDADDYPLMCMNIPTGHIVYGWAEEQRQAMQDYNGIQAQKAQDSGSHIMGTYN